MPEESYAEFARGLVGRFAERVVGADRTSARLVNVRPSDHILGGFITAMARPESDGETPLDELPQDSDYEQTAIGFAWLATRDELAAVTASYRLRLTTYVRALPTFEEQSKFGAWRRKGAPGAPGPADASELEMVLIPVWTRVQLPELTMSVSMHDVVAAGKVRLSLRSEIDLGWNSAVELIEGRFPGSKDITIEKQEFIASNYESWCKSLVRPEGRRDWDVHLDIRVTAVPLQPGAVRVSARLINRTPPAATAQKAFFDSNLYAVDLTVTVPERAHRNGRFQAIEDSYRYDLDLPAVGLNCHTRTRRAAGDIIIETETVARHEAHRLEPRVWPGADPSFDSLSKNPAPALRAILSAMETYEQTEWREVVERLPATQKPEAERDRERFRRDEIDAFRAGLALLEDPRYPMVRTAFALMNRAMGALGRGTGLPTEKQAKRRTYTEWRLFQIVFIVCQLPGLAAREHAELTLPTDSAVEVLWFAAGGGKTEAFLGLVIWQAFFDRLRGKHLGVTAMVRFPLRLLAFQQLQRLARAVAVADAIRDNEGLGGERFSLGYYVGSTQTPNSIDDELHQRLQKERGDQTYKMLSECPYCGAGVRIQYEAPLRRIEHWCESAHCSGGPRPLPIFIVDRDVERFLPTVVVATVDKLAQFGQQQRFGNLLGRISVVCSRHGASFSDVEGKACSAAKALRDGPLEADVRCEGSEVSTGPFYDLGPALLVQDELHLLSEELGTFDAHYETAVAEASRSLGLQPWKIIAATATIADFQQQAKQLYLRSARQFPAPGPSAFESFYFAADRRKLGRIFVGVLGVGRKHTPAVTRALSLLYQELETARQLATADPAAACDRYGMAVLSREDFMAVLFYYELALTYVLTRRGSDQVAEAIEERVKRELTGLFPDAGELRIDTFNGSVAMGAMIDAMRAIENADILAAPSSRVRGLVTTNIISHGVDVERFNLIVFAGFTRLVAEYIQASARVGRRFPGISVLVITPQSERDRSIYGRFAKFHEYLDRLVDPAAVNRWPTGALERTARGLVAGYFMTVAAAKLDRRLESLDRVLRAMGTRGSEAISEDALVAWMGRALGAAERPGYMDAVDTVTRRLFAVIVNGKPAAGALDNLLSVRLHSMRSLRDVDDPAEVVVEAASDAAIMRAFQRA